MVWRINDGRQHGFRIGDITDPKEEVPDLTREVNARVFSKIVENDMALHTLCALGLQGCGKSTYCEYMAYLATTVYGSDVKITVCDDPWVSYQEFDDHPVQMIVVDDAASNLSSQLGAKNRDRFNQWFMVRHIKESVSGTKTGRLIYIFNWQRMNSVHPTFRNPDTWCFLSPMADIKDVEQVRNRLGNRGYNELKKKWDRVQSGDQKAKSMNMVRLPDRETNAGVGWYMSEYMKEFDPGWNGYPRLIRASEYGKAPPVPTKEEVLEQLRNDPETERMVEIYDSYVGEGIPQNRLAEEYGMTQGNISKTICKVEKMVDERIREASA